MSNNSNLEAALEQCQSTSRLIKQLLRGKDGQVVVDEEEEILLLKQKNSVLKTQLIEQAESSAQKDAEIAALKADIVLTQSICEENVEKVASHNFSMEIFVKEKLAEKDAEITTLKKTLAEAMAEKDAKIAALEKTLSAQDEALAAAIRDKNVERLDQKETETWVDLAPPAQAKTECLSEKANCASEEKKDEKVSVLVITETTEEKQDEKENVQRTGESTAESKTESAAQKEEIAALTKEIAVLKEEVETLKQKTENKTVWRVELRSHSRGSLRSYFVDEAAADDFIKRASEAEAMLRKKSAEPLVTFEKCKVSLIPFGKTPHWT